MIARWAGHVARVGKIINLYNTLVGKPKRKRPLGRPRRRWEDNVRMDIRETGWESVDGINLDQDKDQWLAGFCEHGNEPSGSIKEGNFLTS
jgi:hypothetical protein